MNEKIAQAAPNSGASNAADFQPPTQNPQNVQGGVVQQQSGLQGVTNTQEFFNDTQNSSIQITSEPAPARAAVEPTNDAATFAALAVVAIVIGIILFKLSDRLSKRNATVPVSETTTAKAKKQNDAESVRETDKKVAATQTTKKTAAAKPAKKTNTKKNKRKRR